MSSRAKLSIEQLELTVEGETKKRKRRVATDTSIAAGARAAGHIEALRARILVAIAAAAADASRSGATADEVHDTIAATESERADVRRLMNVRRRISDLHNLKRIHPTFIRRLNGLGNPQIVWTTTDASDGSEG